MTLIFRRFALDRFRAGSVAIAVARKRPPLWSLPASLPRTRMITLRDGFLLFTLPTTTRLLCWAPRTMASTGQVGDSR